MRTKNIFNIKKLLLLILISTVGFTGCKDFLDVNDNPNNPDSADPSLLLPTVEAAVSQIVGNSFQVYGGIWGQYWTQNPTSSQYKSVDQFNLSNTSFDRPWLTLYRSALVNAELIITNKTGSTNQHYQGIAYILKAYAFQLATDAFGDIPLTEALNASAYGNPNYDSQEVVYDSIFNYIDKGVALLNVSNATSPGAQDMIFQGDVSKWKAFANTLKLRAYLRISKANQSKASAGIASLYNSGATFLTADASIKYTTTGGNENPLYNEMVGLSRTQNLVASATAVKAFVRNSDPRRFKFYDLVSGQDTIAHIPQGSYNSNTTKAVSPPSALVGARASDPTSATAPVKLISAAESYFLQAEAVARGWASGNAYNLFTQGINQSFTSVGLTAAAATTYIATAPDAAFPVGTEAQVKAIITQKYYAMCGFQGFEAWTEWRRTGYPDFFTPSVASILGQGRTALRFLYPNTEVTSNANFPGTVPIYQPVWWDK
ncbi:SusD-like starch-binding protein associating with outer membrane [Arcticibacter tournemirensis]|uniref:SusD/RagB family nutrient-binding outer membrane lipoprotein n=1 Tax=Arcticibacter tournemirensis TaxID=699437 RepID=A0A5M9GYF0_9SPHI|nr:SusD/RagB family nutrient-binding outer membrane lipoprotein [Arcticibacter tournemirensis]KAA8478427.1 SusD/RagB family nutrient-binding outer membrane lipoprotein [Arcticibacter tournemirensis]TQM48583.1 SusD-like starch-binding protein associating with outer membrane [Arcticibacter tournemirensis]